MNDTISKCQAVLLDGGYSTRLIAVEDVSIVVFEDEVVSGFACVFDDVEQLLTGWQDMETALLRRYSLSLRGAGEKAWNIYCVFLTAGQASAEQGRQVAWIEENLDRTRKIAAYGLSTRDRLVNALLPVLPLQNQPELGVDDVTERLKDRIRQVSPEAATAYLDESVSPSEVVRLLGGRP